MSRGWRPTRTQSLISWNDGPRGTTNHVSTISTASAHENEATDDTPDSIEAILEASGLSPYLLSWGENERAKKTPRISRTIISRIFGSFGRSEYKSEWPKCDSRDYKSFFIADLLAQPFAPASIGHQGLALLFPEWASDDDEDMFHAFVAVKMGGTALEYMGDYTKVPLLRKTIEWSLLPVIVRPPLIYFVCVSDAT